MKLRVPSPGLVVAVIALVAALGATAYAATLITSSSQIKAGVVNSGDIKNGTIQSSDLSKSLQKRLTGSSATSSTVATEVFRKQGPLNQPANQLIKVMTTSIPAGSYVISAKTTLAGIVQQPGLLEKGVVAATANCQLDAGGDMDQANTVTVVESRQTPSTLYMQTTRTVAGATDVTLSCASSSPWHATDTSIIAQRVSGTDKKEGGA